MKMKTDRSLVFVEIHQNNKYEDMCLKNVLNKNISIAPFKSGNMIMLSILLCKQHENYTYVSNIYICYI